jgi:hypothetical protein
MRYRLMVIHDVESFGLRWTAWRTVRLHAAVLAVQSGCQLGCQKVACSTALYVTVAMFSLAHCTRSIIAPHLAVAPREQSLNVSERGGHGLE